MNLKKFSKKLIKNEKGQGMVEYILLLVVVVAMVAIFKKPILEKVGNMTEDLKGKIDQVTN